MSKFIKAVSDQKQKIKDILIGIDMSEPAADDLADFSTHLSVYKAVALDLGLEPGVANLLTQEMYASYLMQNKLVTDELVKVVKDPVRMAKYLDAVHQHTKESHLAEAERLSKLEAKPAGEKAVVSNEAVGTLSDAPSKLLH
jgi:hypothetical protein